MYRTMQRSWELYDRAIQVIPLATQTHAKAPRSALRGIEPCYLTHGQGCRVWDVDGNEYIDLRNALGPITLGYRYPAVESAVRQQLESGSVFSYSHPLEVEVAERLVERIPCAEMVRFLRTGGEAMAAAIHLARVYTQRPLVLTCGYHGWLSSVFRPGVPEAIRSVYREMPWGEIEPYEQAFAQAPEQIAAISVACDYAQITRGRTFLPALRALTEKQGALLIFDEIVTGFRLAQAGAQEYFRVTPDMAVFAKGISNGFPLSCYVGRRDILRRVEDSPVSSTFGGDTLALAAAKAVLEVYSQEDVIGALWKRGLQLHRGMAEICAELDIPAGFFGLPPVGTFQFTHPDANRNEALFLRFNAETLQRGVIIYNVCYPSFSHQESDIAQVLEAMKASLQAMQTDSLFD